MDNPYRHLPNKAFWSRGVSRNFQPGDLYAGARPLLPQNARVMSAGSCFAANLVPYLEANGFTYVRTEPLSQRLGVAEEALSYGKFSAAYGNLYTPRQLLQLIQRALGRFRPLEDRWRIDGKVIDPFRPGLRYMASSDGEFDALTKSHLAAVIRAIETCDAFIFTLGLTEAWVSAIDSAVFPACPGTVHGEFDAAKHKFQNFTAAETTADLIAALRLVRETNPSCRIILTVSPVPLVATATGGHVLTSTIYSKSVLRVAAEAATQEVPDCFYFPAYEIVTGPQAPKDFFAENRRDVTTEAIATVMSGFFACCDVTGAQLNVTQAAEATQAPASAAQTLVERIAAIECEEAAADLF